MSVAFIAVIVIILFIVLAFYFTLTFVEHLHKGDERLTKQSKTAALVCFGLAIIIFVGLIYLFLFFIAAGSNSV